MYQKMYQHLRLGPLSALESCDLMNLDKINVLCGKNNTGKSTLLEAASNPLTDRVFLTRFDGEIRIVDATRKHLFFTI